MGGGKFRAPGADDQGLVGRVQPAKPTPERDHPLVMDDIEGAGHAPDFLDVVKVALKNRQQILLDHVSHVRVEMRQCRGQGFDILGVEGGDVQDFVILAVEYQGVIVGLEPAHQRIHRLMMSAEHFIQLSLERERAGAGCVGVVIPTSTASIAVSF